MALKFEPVYLSQLVALDASGELPGEFLLFREGENASTKGSVWFDDVSAREVMADAETYANDFAIDLDHRMVKPRVVDATNTDADAMGWHRLAVRDGELWAVNVSWTPEGERRLRERRQRYTSPAFYTQPDEQGRDRVVRYTNCAICARPATHDIPPLVATDAPTLDGRTESGYGANRMPSDQATPPAPAPPIEADAPAVAAPAEPAAPLETDAPPAPAVVVAEGPSPEELEVIALAPGATDVRSALVILRARACDVTGAADLRGALAFATGALVAVRNADVAERRALVTTLVEFGAETPGTAWCNGAMAARLASEPLDALRSRVAALRDARPAASAGALTAPAVAELADLSEVERAEAEKIKDPKARSRFIARRRERAATRAAAQK